jgi:hypothetical protein
MVGIARGRAHDAHILGQDFRKVHEKPPERHGMVTNFEAGRVEIVLSAICGKVWRYPLSEGARGALMARPVHPARPRKSREKRRGKVPSKQSSRPRKSAARKVSCEDCFFHTNLLCALELNEPCSTFRPSEAELRPPQQLRFVFRQERRSRAAWAFPSAQEQAALHS